MLPPSCTKPTPAYGGEYRSRSTGLLRHADRVRRRQLERDDILRCLPHRVECAMVLYSIHVFPDEVGATAPGTMIEGNMVEIHLWFHEEVYQNHENSLRAGSGFVSH